MPKADRTAYEMENAGNAAKESKAPVPVTPKKVESTAVKKIAHCEYHLISSLILLSL